MKDKKYLEEILNLQRQSLFFLCSITTILVATISIAIIYVQGLWIKLIFIAAGNVIVLFPLSDIVRMIIKIDKTKIKIKELEELV